MPASKLLDNDDVEENGRRTRDHVNIIMEKHLAICHSASHVLHALVASVARSNSYGVSVRCFLSRLRFIFSM